MTASAPGVTGLPFRVLSRLRGSRIFHPQGFAVSGTWSIERGSPLAPAAPVLQPGFEAAVVGRFSRGAGLPQWMGEVFGLAVRLPDAGGPRRHQDVLANLSADQPVAHHVFLPAPHWYARAYSTCLPYRAGARPFVLGWLPPQATTPGPTLDDMAQEVRAGRATFGIAIAGAARGRFERLGTLRLDTLRPELDLAFDPVAHTGGGLEPTGALNALRGPAYRASQRGRGGLPASDA